MTGKQIAATLKNGRGRALIHVNADIQIGKQDELAGEILEMIYSRYPDKLMGDIASGLDAARWWIVALASINEVTEVK